MRLLEVTILKKVIFFRFVDCSFLLLLSINLYRITLIFLISISPFPILNYYSYKVYIR